MSISPLIVTYDSICIVPHFCTSQYGQDEIIHAPFDTVVGVHGIFAFSERHTPLFRSGSGVAVLNGGILFFLQKLAIILWRLALLFMEQPTEIEGIIISHNGSDLSYGIICGFQQVLSVVHA